MDQFSKAVREYERQIRDRAADLVKKGLSPYEALSRAQQELAERSGRL